MRERLVMKSLAIQGPQPPGLTQEINNLSASIGTFNNYNIQSRSQQQAVTGLPALPLATPINLHESLTSQPKEPHLNGNSLLALQHEVRLWG